MLRLADIRLPLEHDDGALPAAICARLGVGADRLLNFRVCRRGHDARQRHAIKLVYSVDVEVADEQEVLGRPGHGAIPSPARGYRFPVTAPAAPGGRPLIVGAGPAGLFAALVLAEHGFRPLLLERGRPVAERAAVVAGFWRDGRLDPETNIQFGEGGAGTFSDGKLHTGTRDREQRQRKVLDELVAAGAPAEILVDAKPHIGTGKLVRVVAALRQRIIALGGEVRCACRVDDLEIAAGRVRGVVLAGGEKLAAGCVILAAGHSARDTYAMLLARGVQLEAKPFAVGLRLEHPQALIDRARFGKFAGHPRLGAADYKLVHHGSDGRAVYSFCMCPGGTVLAASSEPGGVVTNGMSEYARDSGNANGAIVVEVTPADYPGGPLAGIEYQRRYEQLAFAAGGGSYCAPAQLVGDFLAVRPSTAAGGVLPSYRPGVKFGDFGGCLPGYVIAAIRAALPVFAGQLEGFALPDAVLTGVETRTSSPVRIVRGEDGQSVTVRGLYPAGEGAGYAGGIMSSAVDGIRAAEALARDLAGLLAPPA